MKITRKDLQDGGCNFCKRGELIKDPRRTMIKYPYSEVTEISADKSGLSAHICDQCLDKLKKFTP